MPTITGQEPLAPKCAAELETSPDFDELMLLRQLDDAGRVPGAVVGTVDEATRFSQGVRSAGNGWQFHWPGGAARWLILRCSVTRPGKDRRLLSGSFGRYQPPVLPGTLTMK